MKTIVSLFHVAPRFSRLLVSALCMMFLSVGYVEFACSADIEISWEKYPSSNPTGYNVYYGLSSQVYDYYVHVIDQTRCVLTGLESGKTYFISVTAYNAYGFESNLSEEISYTLPFESNETNSIIALVEDENYLPLSTPTPVLPSQFVETPTPTVTPTPTLTPQSVASPTPTVTPTPVRESM